MWRLRWSSMPTLCRPCQSVGKASLAAAIIVVAAGLTLIFLFDLPGGDDVGPGPMCKYKLITTHFQVHCLQYSWESPHGRHCRCRRLLTRAELTCLTVLGEACI